MHIFLRIKHHPNCSKMAPEIKCVIIQVFLFHILLCLPEGRDFWIQNESRTIEMQILSYLPEDRALCYPVLSQISGGIVWQPSQRLVVNRMGLCSLNKEPQTSNSHVEHAVGFCLSSVSVALWNDDCDTRTKWSHIIRCLLVNARGLPDVQMDRSIGHRLIWFRNAPITFVCECAKGGHALPNKKSILDGAIR